MLFKTEAGLKIIYSSPADYSNNDDSAPQKIKKRVVSPKIIRYDRESERIF